MAGVALTLIAATQPDMGTSYIVDAFLVVVAGGIGQVEGAVIAAFGLGVLQAVFAYSTSGQHGEGAAAARRRRVPAAATAGPVQCPDQEPA